KVAPSSWIGTAATSPSPRRSRLTPWRLRPEQLRPTPIRVGKRFRLWRMPRLGRQHHDDPGPRDGEHRRYRTGRGRPDRCVAAMSASPFVEPLASREDRRDRGRVFGLALALAALSGAVELGHE